MTVTTRSKNTNNLTEIMKEQSDMNEGFTPASEFSRTSKKKNENALRRSNSPLKVEDRNIFDYPYRWMFSFVLTPMKLTWEI